VSRSNIGVAIAVPQPYRDDLQAWRERFGDPNARAIVPHVTLLPPTLVPDDELDAIEKHLGVAAADARLFSLRLRGTGTFRPVSPVVFVPLVEGISECEQLERAVRSGPLDRDTRFPYHPHVTVAHDLPDPALDRAFDALADYDARFDVSTFSLFAQDRVGVWQPLREFRFGAGPPPPAEDLEAPGW
jgi:2'-5' RNA ligase